MHDSRLRLRSILQSNRYFNVILIQSLLPSLDSHFVLSGDISDLVLPDDERVRSIISKSILRRITLLIFIFSYALYFLEP